MQMEDTNNLGVVEDSSAVPTLGDGIETSLQFSEVQEPEPKDVNQYLEYMRQKREALERAAVADATPTETASVVEEPAVEETSWESEEAKEPKNEEGESMKKKDEMETEVKAEEAGEGSIEDMVAQAMQQDEILLYQQKYLESLEARKNKVETIISMLQKEKETIDAQIQAVK